MLTLGPASGATSTVFAVVNGVLLRPLPFPDPERLVRVSYGPPPGPPGAAAGHREPGRGAARGLAGSVAAFASVRARLALAPERWIPRAEAIHPDPTVLGFTLLAASLLGLVLPLVPALAAQPRWPS